MYKKKKYLLIKDGRIGEECEMGENYTICVLGAGTMGHGIAQISAFSKYIGKIYLYDISNSALDTAREKMVRSIHRLMRNARWLRNHRKLMNPAIYKRFISKEAGTEDEIIEIILNKIEFTDNLEKALNGVDFIIEAIPENLQLKRRVFSLIEKILKSRKLRENSQNTDIILATNTSYIKISEIKENLDPYHKKRFIGMHFFNPPVLMDAVELVYDDEIPERMLKAAEQFIKSMGKKPIRVKDSPGFVVNRLLMMPQVLLCGLLEKGIVDPIIFDKNFKSMGFKMGPYEMLDFIGLDIVLEGMEYMAHALDPEFGPPKWLKNKVKKGELGLKTNRGIFKWENGSATRLSADMKKKIENVKLNDGKIEIGALDLMLVQIKEISRVMKESLVNNLNDIDILIKNGTVNRLGLLNLFHSLDESELHKRLEMLAELTGIKRFKPDEIYKSFIKNFHLKKKND